MAVLVVILCGNRANLAVDARPASWIVHLSEYRTELRVVSCTAVPSSIFNSNAAQAVCVFFFLFLCCRSRAGVRAGVRSLGRGGLWTRSDCAAKETRRTEGLGGLILFGASTRKKNFFIAQKYNKVF